MPPRVVKKTAVKRKARAVAGTGIASASSAAAAAPHSVVSSEVGHLVLPKSEPLSKNQIVDESEKESKTKEVDKEGETPKSGKVGTVIKTPSFKRSAVAKKTPAAFALAEANAKAKGEGGKVPAKCKDTSKNVDEETKEPEKEELKAKQEENVDEGEKDGEISNQGEKDEEISNQGESAVEIEKEPVKDKVSNEKEEEVAMLEAEESMEEDEEDEEEIEAMEKVFLKGENNAVSEVGEEGSEAIVAVNNAKPSSSRGGDEIEDTGSESEDEAGPVIGMPPLQSNKESKDVEIFIGQLPEDAVEEDVMKVFKGFGEIKSVKVIRNPLRNKSKGFAFLCFSSSDASVKALEAFKDGTEIKGKKVCVSMTQQDNTLYVGNICNTWTKDELLKALKNLGIEEIDEINLPEDPHSKPNSKGFALIKFISDFHAKLAFETLIKPTSILGCNRSARVKFTEHHTEEAVSQVKTVYLQPILEHWDGEKVNEICKKFGEIEKVKICRRRRSKNKSDNKKDYALVEFVSRENALNCVEGLTNAQIDVGDNLKLCVQLARPPVRGRFPKYAMRGGFVVKNLNWREKEKEKKKEKEREKEKKVEIGEVKQVSKTNMRREKQKFKKGANPLSVQKTIKKNNNYYNTSSRGPPHVQVAKRAGPVTQTNINMNMNRKRPFGFKGAESASSSKRSFKGKKDANNKGPKFPQGRKDVDKHRSMHSGYAYAPPAYTNAAPPTYPNMAPPTYANAAPPAYSNMAPPAYSNVAPPAYPSLYQPVRHEPVIHEPVRVARQEPIRYEPRTYELTRYEPARYEPVRHEPARYDPLRHEPARYDPLRHEPARYDPLRHEPTRYESSRRHEPMSSELYSSYASGSHTVSSDMAPRAGYGGTTSRVLNNNYNTTHVYEPRSGAVQGQYHGFEINIGYPREQPIPQTTSRPGYVPPYPSYQQGGANAYPPSGSYTGEYPPRRTYY